MLSIYNWTFSSLGTMTFAGDDFLLKKEANRLLTCSMAPNSHIAYNICMRKFETFMTGRGTKMFSLDTSSWIKYNRAYLSLEGLAYTTIVLYVVSHFYKIRNHHDPTKSFMIKKMLEGYKRNKHKSDIRRPLILEILKSFISHLHYTYFNTYEQILFHAIFLISFHGFLRISEFTMYNKISQTDRMIQLKDGQITHECMYITIRFSKWYTCCYPCSWVLSRLVHRYNDGRIFETQISFAWSPIHAYQLYSSNNISILCYAKQTSFFGFKTSTHN